MRALLAFDKFKDALSAAEACERAAAALRSVRPDWELDLCPLTDGGEGFAEILTTAAGGTIRRAWVTGPRGERVEARYGWVAARRIPAAARRLLDLPAVETLAVIEMAQASGLALLSAADRDPWLTTSVGTGELMRLAATDGAEAILLGVGGSATNDLGLGALAALGVEARTASGAALSPPVPATWEHLATLAGTAVRLPPVRIACDVTNPLLGPTGATAVYGPQKGLQAADFARLEAQAARVAARVCAHFGQPEDLAARPGAGAAGGITFGLMAATGAQLLPGAAFVSAWLDLDRRLAAADLLLTGEGRFDESSLSGKGPGAVAAQALAAGRSVHVFAGAVAPLPGRPGLHTHALSPPGLPLAQALAETGWRLDAAVRAALGPEGGT